MDWNYISGGTSPLWYPLQTLSNNLVGYFLCIFVFMVWSCLLPLLHFRTNVLNLKGVYYNNVWDAKKFPFLSQLLFTAESNGTNYVTFNQTAILDSTNRVNQTLVDEQGLPFYTATFAVAQLTTNMALTATFVHMLLWNYDDISSGWAFINKENFRKVLRPTTWKWRFWETNDEEYKARMLASPNTDPHYRRECNFS